MPIEITTLQPKQWKKYKELRISALKTYPQMFGSTVEEEEQYPDNKWKERLVSSNSVTLFAKDTKTRTLVGMMAAYWNIERKSSEHIVNLVSVYVDRHYQKLGIASMLMEKLIQLLQEKGFEKVKLTCNSDNTQALGLYKKFGFREVGVLENELRVGDRYFNEILFEKLIAPADFNQ